MIAWGWSEDCYELLMGWIGVAVRKKMKTGNGLLAWVELLTEVRETRGRAAWGEILFQPCYI